MPQPALRLALWLVPFLLATTAAAQPYPLPRERVERRAPLPAGPGEAVLEVRVARDVLTTLILHAPVEKASVELDGRVSHFKLVEIAERAITLEPSVELGATERLGLRMRLKDGTAVALVLIADPSLVDTRVDLERPLPPEAMRAELAETKARLAALQAQCGEDGPVGLVRSGRLDRTGVRAEPVAAETPSGSGAGPTLIKGTGFRAGAWALVDVALRLPLGSKPWVLSEARLVAPGGLVVPAVPMWRSKPRLAPGEEGRVILQTAAPHWDAGTRFRLELSSGDSLPILLGTVAL